MRVIQENQRVPILPQYRSRKVSLKDMLTFFASKFHEMSGMLVKLHVDPNFLVSDEGKEAFKKMFPGLHKVCSEMGLTLSVNKIEEIYHAVGHGNTTQVKNVIRLLKELDERIYEELESEWFFYIPRQDVPYLQPMGALYDQQLEAAFPWATNELEDAGSCYAFEQYTASVFHSMRALERGLFALAFQMGMAPEQYTLENWKNVIDMIEKKIREMEQLPKSQEKTKFLEMHSKLAVQFRYFKDAWRNHVAHGRATYEVSEARRIMNGVFDFLCEATKAGLYEVKA